MGFCGFGLLRVFLSQLVRHRAGDGERLRVDPCRDAAGCKRRKDSFGRNVSHQIIACKRAAAKAGERTIETPATRFVRREYFFGGALWPAVQMHADLDARSEE